MVIGQGVLRPLARSIPDSVDPAMRRRWGELTLPTPSPLLFDLGMLAGLPEPVRRWLAHAIAPGAPLYRSGVLRQDGRIKVGRWWRPYQADWALSPPKGFIWAATVDAGPLTIQGSDCYARGVGAMRWDVLGLLPIIRATGPTITRSSIGRLASELCFVPAAALSAEVAWMPIDGDRARATVTIDGVASRLIITVAPTGALTRVDVARWGQPDGKRFREHIFTAVLDDPEHTFDGYTIPSAVRAGWWRCPDGCAAEEFIQFDVEQASYQ